MMYQWASKFLAAYFGQSNRDEIIKKYPKEKLKQLIIEVLNTSKKFLTDLQSQEVKLWYI